MILSGKPVAEKIYEGLVQGLRKISRRPKLAVILVGEDPASLSYLRVKEKIAKRLGIGFEMFHLPGAVQEKVVEKLIEDLNQNESISGIIVQLPLPGRFEQEKILKKIDRRKDIDGFYSDLSAPTAQGILEILKFYKIGLEKKRVVLVGHGRLVGKPLEKLLSKQAVKPIICDLKTANLNKKLKTADIIVSATGVVGLIKPEMVTSETIIIDAGTAEAKGKLVGDVDPSVYNKVKAYSPVPGGVGPVTVACLMRNVVLAAKIIK